MAKQSKSTRKRVTALKDAPRKKAPTLGSRLKVMTAQHGELLDLQRETLAQLAAVLERTSALEQRNAEEDARAAAFVDRFNREHRSLLDRVENRLTDPAPAINFKFDGASAELPTDATDAKTLFHLVEPPPSRLKRFLGWARSI